MMQIIPAIDIIDGQCVRLTKGDYCRKKVYNSDPVEVARDFESMGVEKLHLVDLDGAKAKHVVNLDVLQRISTETHLDVDFGGGLKTDDDLQKVFNAGAKQITGGSIAVKDPKVFLTWLKEYGSDKIILGADVLDRKVMVTGWTEDSNLDVMPFISKYVSEGLEYVICTDVAVDGTLTAPSFKLYKEILMEFPELKLIASGGVSSTDDLKRLADEGLYGAIVGKAIYEGKINLKEIL